MAGHPVLDDLITFYPFLEEIGEAVCVTTPEATPVYINPSFKNMFQCQHLEEFEMFYRGNVKTTGSGLGLYLVVENLKKLKGSIKVESSEGESTSFIIVLPNLKAAV